MQKLNTPAPIIHLSTFYFPFSRAASPVPPCVSFRTRRRRREESVYRLAPAQATFCIPATCPPGAEAGIQFLVRFVLPVRRVRIVRFCTLISQLVRRSPAMLCCGFIRLRQISPSLRFKQKSLASHPPSAVSSLQAQQQSSDNVRYHHTKARDPACL